MNQELQFPISMLKENETMLLPALKTEKTSGESWMHEVLGPLRRNRPLSILVFILALVCGSSKAQTNEYGYDYLNRLVHEEHPDGTNGTTIDYVYDALGNRLMKTTTLAGAPSNQPPAVVTNPSIANGATNISTTPLLSWNRAVDPNSGDSVVYFIYFGTTPTPPLVFSGWPTNWSPGHVRGNTTYYWSVVARDSHNSQTASPVWSFTTANEPPIADFTASPTNGWAPLTVTFRDHSISTDDSIVSWAWDFNNDGTVDSTNQNPTFIYASVGVFTVKLTVGDEHGGIGTVIETNLVSVLPSVTIGDTSVVEGDAGTTNAVFTVSLNAPSAQTVTVGYSTANGTALAGSDFIATNGVVTFAAGVTNQTLAVPVIGDIAVESDEVFYVRLSNATNAVITRAQGVGTIVNDDGLPGQVHHFVWSVISSPQRSGTPFPVTITAQDLSSNIASGFTGSVAVEASTQRANTLLGNAVDSGSSSDSSTGYTDANAFTPNKDILVTHVRHYYGNKVSIWTDSGTLLASKLVTSIPGTWVETPLDAPVQLIAGNHYRVGVNYPAGTTFYWRDDMGNSFTDGTIDESYYAVGDAFPDKLYGVRWAFVDVRYTVGTLTSILITPASSGSFANGVWAGYLTLTGTGPNVVLEAVDAVGHSGTANPLTVLTVTPPLLILGASVQDGLFVISFNGKVGETYTVQASTNLLNWQPLTNFVGTNLLFYFSDSGVTNYNLRFYRVVVP